ncbi:Uncharacterised protein [Halioglobus japonicus]|nr:Uncharacterised protein [Halioglobus japonicus]
MSPIYRGIYKAGQALRKRHYKLFRAIVENPLVRSIIQRVYGSRIVSVQTPESYTLAINPVYHGNFLTTQSILQYEPEMRALFENEVSAGMVVYDIGANVGVFSLQFCQIVGEHGQVYAFEPEENNLRCLLQTKVSNKLSNLEVHEKGVGQYTENLFFDRRGGAMSGRVVDSGSENTENVTQMQVISVDDFVYSQGGRPPSLMKIDVEGNEVKVIDGALRTLEEHHPIIICELHHSIEPAVIVIYDVLSKLGYQCFDVDGHKPNKDEPLDSFVNVHHFIAFANRTA